MPSSYEIKTAIGYNEQLKDTRAAMFFYLGVTTLCGAVAAINLNPSAVNDLLNMALKTTTEYLPNDFGNQSVGMYSALAGGISFAKTLAKKEGRKTMKYMMRQIENYESIMSAGDESQPTK